MKILLITNNVMSVPVMHMLMQNNLLSGIACASKNPEHTNHFKQLSAQGGIPLTILRHATFKEQLFQLLTDTQPDMVVVYCFGWMLPEQLLTIPKYGFINMHAGLLPEMRGADPIFEAIRQRKSVAGMTLHRMAQSFDSGNIIKREQVPLNPEMTYGMLSRQLAMIGAKLLGEVIQAVMQGEAIQEYAQDETQACYYPRLAPGQLMLNWSEMTSAEIKALVKACNPVGKSAPARLNEWMIGVCEVSDVSLQGSDSNIKPGTILALDRQNGLVVYCKDGKALNIEITYTEDAFLPGYKLEMYGLKPGMCFS
jgi:methionyl-tRNA formyltransferase